MMNDEKYIQQVMDWLNNSVSDIDIEDQFKIGLAYSKFLNEIEPIYLKYNAKVFNINIKDLK